MTDLIEQALVQYEMLKDAKAVLAAVSGGRDSMALLHALHALGGRMGFALYAIHVDHNLRTSSKEDCRLVERFAAKLGVPLRVVSLDVANRRVKGESLETAARRLRYEAFDEALRALPQSCVLALAHHRRDQAETVLMHLLRGSGTRGLAGMRPVRWPYIRPMLFVPYERICDYVAGNNIPFREDESNEDLRFTRNRIRQKLIPELKRDYNANIERALCSTATAAGEDEAFLQSLAQAQREPLQWRCVPDLAVWMSRDGFSALAAPIQKRLLRMALETLGIYHMEENVLNLAQALHNRGGAVQLGEGLFIRAGQHVEVFRQKAKETGTVPLPLEGSMRFGYFDILVRETGDVCEPCDDFTLLMCYDDAVSTSVRTRRPGDAIAYETGCKKLGDAMTQMRVPLCIRDHLPVLVRSEQVIWAPMLKPGCGLVKPALDSRMLKIEIRMRAHCV